MFQQSQPQTQQPGSRVSLVCSRSRENDGGTVRYQMGKARGGMESRCSQALKATVMALVFLLSGWEAVTWPDLILTVSYDSPVEERLKRGKSGIGAP